MLNSINLTEVSQSNSVSTVKGHINITIDFELDAASFSELGYALNALTTLEAAPADEVRLASLREQYQQGQYQVDFEKVAEAMATQDTLD